MASWIRKEFSGVRFGDQRLDERLMKLGERLLEKPSLSLNQGQGDWASSKAAYRFFENDKVDIKSILEAHVSRTCERIKESSGTVLAIQDTTTLDYSPFKSIEGLCEIYRNERTREGTEGGQGLLVHSTFAVSADGLPLGLMDQKIFTHSKVTKKESNKNRPIQRKESYRWIQSIEQTAKLFPVQKNIVHVCDREGDIFEFFFFAQTHGIHYLVRAAKDRVVGHRFKGWSTIKNKNKTLWKFMEEQPIAGYRIVEIPKHHKTRSRQARCEVRFSKVVYTPSYRSPKAWYQHRWHIENYHKVLKSGCNIEKTRLNHIDKLKVFITLMSVIAYRVYKLTWVARISPTQDCRMVLSESEWKALDCFRHKTKELPQAIPSVLEVTRWLAMLGGFLGRKRDGQPGVTTVWRGWQRLREITEAWDIFNNCTATSG